MRSPPIRGDWNCFKRRGAWIRLVEQRVLIGAIVDVAAGFWEPSRAGRLTSSENGATRKRRAYFQ
jgi:hypothetical protein